MASPGGRPDEPAPARSASGEHAKPRFVELLTLLCGAVVVITSNMGMLGPLLLQLSDELGVSLAQTGLLASATALPWALAAPVLGPLSDRFGRRRVLAGSLTGLGLATLSGAFVQSYGLLLAVRVLSGLLASAGPTSLMAAVGDHVPLSHRASALGWVNTGFGLAALAGVPAVGAVGGAFGWRWAFITMGTATLLLAALIWWRLPGHPPRARPPGGVRVAYRRVLTNQGLPSILTANVLERSVYAIFGLYLAAFLMQTYVVSLLEVAPMLAIMAVGMIAGNVIGGRLADRRSQPGVFAAGQLASAVFVVAYFAVDTGLLASIALGATFGLTTSASRPAIIAMASSLSTEHRGTALGIFSFTNQLGWALGPALAGLVFAWAGYAAIGALSALAAVGAAVCMLWLPRARTASVAPTGQ